MSMLDPVTGNPETFSFEPFGTLLSDDDAFAQMLAAEEAALDAAFQPDQPNSRRMEALSPQPLRHRADGAGGGEGPGDDLEKMHRGR